MSQVFTIPVPVKLVSPNSNRKRQEVTPCLGKKGINETKIDQGSYSRGCTYRKYCYKYLVNSVGTIINKGRTLIWLDWNHIKHRYMLPHGWKWKLDSNGCKLYKVNTDIDLHIDAGLLKSSISELISIAIQNYRVRLTNNFDSALSSLRRINLSLSDVFVFRKDSYNAGNCKIGTEQWLTNLGLNDKMCVRASELLLDTRSKLAVCQAINRTLLDIERGYCER